LRDVAEAADVHMSTASRALNPKTRSVVNAETAERVLAAAEKLGYSPHPLARGLRTSQTLSIGVVIPDLENPLFGPIIAGIEGGLVANGYSVLITAATSGNEGEAVRSLLDHRVDGLILASASRTDPVLERLAEIGTPTVLVNRRAENVALPAIVGDDQLGIQLVVDHLVEMGHSVIGHIAGPDQMSTGWGRRRAFEEVMRDHGLRIIVEDGVRFQVDPGVAATERLLEREPAITAIVAANDLLGLGAYRAVRAAGRRVGADIAITGYNDVTMLDLMEPPMTAVSVAYRQMGSQAAELVLELREGGDAPTTTLLEPMLSIRASTRTVS
jgi:LacI family transcriptional regulator